MPCAGLAPAEHHVLCGGCTEGVFRLVPPSRDVPVWSTASQAPLSADTNFDSCQSPSGEISDDLVAVSQFSHISLHGDSPVISLDVLIPQVQEEEPFFPCEHQLDCDFFVSIDGNDWHNSFWSHSDFAEPHFLRPFVTRFHSEPFDVTHSGALHEVSAGQDMYINIARVGADVSASTAVNNGFALSQDWSVLYKAAELGRTWDQWCVIDYIMHMAKPKYLGLVLIAYNMFVDWSCYRAEDQAAWAFVVVSEDAMGDVVLEGFAADFLSHQSAADMACSDVDYICVEAVSILFAYLCRSSEYPCCVCLVAQANPHPGEHHF